MTRMTFYILKRTRKKDENENTQVDVLNNVEKGDKSTKEYSYFSKWLTTYLVGFLYRMTKINKGALSIVHNIRCHTKGISKRGCVLSLLFFVLFA